MKKVSILYVTLSTVRAGVEEHILTLLRGLNRDLFEPHLAATGQLLAALGNDIPGDVEVFPCNPDKAGWAREAIRLAALLRRLKIHVLHSHMFRSSAFASPVGWFCRVPLIVETSHGREAWRRSWLKRSYIVDRFVNRFVDRTIAVSEANGRYLHYEKRLPAGKIVVIRNGCDLERFRPDHPAPSELRAQWNIGVNDPVILVIGRLEPQKGHATLLEALPQVIARFPAARVVCLGDGRLRTQLEGQSRALGLDRNVRFVGFQNNVSDWLALANFTVLPSLYEGLPLVAVESLAAGKAMVATAVEGTPEVILNGQTGLLVGPGDPVELGRGIQRLLDHPELARQMGVAGRSRVEEHFTQQAQVNRTERLYAQKLAANGVRLICRNEAARPVV